MKKNYISPTMKVHKVKVSSHLLLGVSNVKGADTNYKTADTSDTGQADAKAGSDFSSENGLW